MHLRIVLPGPADDQRPDLHLDTNRELASTDRVGDLSGHLVRVRRRSEAAKVSGCSTSIVPVTSPGSSSSDRQAPVAASIAVLIPVKSFDLAKGRLSDTLRPDQRAELARTMATGVVTAAAPLPVFVVCGSAEVADWAAEVNAQVIWHEPPGLNPAVTHATMTLEDSRYDRVVIAHGDLPLATSLAWVADFDGVTIVPDRPGQGTNVMAVPLGRGFEYHYGPGSAQAHQAEAHRLGLAVRIMTDDALGLDVDTPDDLAELDREHNRLAAEDPTGNETELEQENRP